MAERDDGQDRTEDPTARRLEEARNEGQIAKSPEFSAAVLLLAGTAALASVGEAMSALPIRLMRESARSLSTGGLSPDAAVHALRSAAMGLILAIVPFVLWVAFASVGAGLVQTGGLTTTRVLTPKLDHLDPTRGVRRLLSADGLVTLGKSLVKLAALGIVTWLVLRGNWPELMSLVQTGPAAVGAVTRQLALKLAGLTGLAFLVLSGADYAWQRWRLARQLRMTKQEVGREHRESEGDPQVKARIRSMQRARARQRMLQDVARADVVVTNPTHVAVALRYDPERSPAPVIVAMGERKLAERIKHIAAAANVPVLEHKPLARALLASGAVGHPVPAALFAAVAEILAFVYRRRAGLPVEFRPTAGVHLG